MVRCAVVTWFGSEKAIAIAVAAHERGGGDDNDAQVVEVDVLAEGAAARAPDGTAVVESGDLADRFEW